MPDRMTRRAAVAQLLLPAVAAAAEDTLKTRLAELDKSSGGRLGVAVLDSASGSMVSHRGGERFPMCSTFKASAVACVLQRVDRNKENLNRRIIFSERDILSYAPVTKLHVGAEGMTVRDLCAAAITVSDNTAANLLLAGFGGPGALTKFWRSIGDAVTRLDRIEPDLNEAAPGDPRDTTSPLAMAQNLHRFVVDDVLSPSSRELFTKWLIANTTGDTRLRAGLPKNWRVGDKTGSGAHQTNNDVAVIWPTGRKPVFVAAYLTQGPAAEEERSKTLADVGRAVAAQI